MDEFGLDSAHVGRPIQVRGYVWRLAKHSPSWTWRGSPRRDAVVRTGYNVVESATTRTAGSCPNRVISVGQADIYARCGHTTIVVRLVHAEVDRCCWVRVRRCYGATAN
jgi:hypothetical protein